MTEPETKSTFDRRSAIVGAVVGLVVGGMLVGVVAMPMASDAPAGPAARLVPAPASDAGAKAPEPQEPMTPSFAQQGEDLVMLQILRSHGVRRPTYLDIGAHDPIQNSNTYWFYKLGSDGVLVEPNPAYAAKLKKVRPRDTVLEVGVGVTNEAEADYYLFDGDGQLNTFSKKQADLKVAQRHRKIIQTMKRKLVPINQILEENFKQGSPHVLSVDAEGMDYEILKSVDWKRWRPMIVCTETADPETGKVEQEIVELMKKQGYAVRGGSWVNTIFVDEEATPTGSADAGADAAPR
jgi:FkbM family methyltransferase